ncbi:NTF2 fold immunity protein [Pseudomonas sp. CGJS7]|uniref:NTF2 fold immunity protein n=1 Tax=Pseudomonas sp. CGJS7 TaxID=3109348 RepID=UPI00300895E7
MSGQSDTGADMSAGDTQDAEAVLGEFFAQMHAWEVAAHELAERGNGGLEQNLERIRQPLVLIYERFLTPKERKTGRLAGPDVGWPPEYDPAQEPIVDSRRSGAKAVFETRWTHPTVADFSQRKKYYLLEKGGQWRIDKKEVFDTIKDKWVARVF